MTGKRIRTSLAFKYVFVISWQKAIIILLQVSRWYPAAALLSNGSIVVIGGEIGTAGPPEPSLELLPRTPGGNTTVYLDWLRRTDPHNLYPFVIILPSGGLFVGKKTGLSTCESHFKKYFQRTTMKRGSLIKRRSRPSRFYRIALPRSIIVGDVRILSCVQLILSCA